MSAPSWFTRSWNLAAILLLAAVGGTADEPAAMPRAGIDGTGLGWRSLGEEDFTAVNCTPETWTWKDGVIHCTGKPVGVVRTEKPSPISSSSPGGGISVRQATRDSSSGPRSGPLPA